MQDTSLQTRLRPLRRLIRRGPPSKQEISDGFAKLNIWARVTTRRPESILLLMTVDFGHEDLVNAVVISVSILYCYMVTSS